MNLNEFKEKILFEECHDNCNEFWILQDTSMEEYHTIATLKEDLSISLRFRSDYVVKDFREEWANKWPNPNANSTYIDFCYHGEVIYQELVVSIDGSRGLILCPHMIFKDGKIEGYKYSPEEYKIAKLIEQLFSTHEKSVDYVKKRENWKII